jgi:hypothetical protein
MFRNQVSYGSHLVSKSSPYENLDNRSAHGILWSELRVASLPRGIFAFIE